MRLATRSSARLPTTSETARSANWAGRADGQDARLVSLTRRTWTLCFGYSRITRAYFSRRTKPFAHARERHLTNAELLNVNHQMHPSLR